MRDALKTSIARCVGRARSGGCTELLERGDVASYVSTIRLEPGQTGMRIDRSYVIEEME